MMRAALIPLLALVLMGVCVSASVLTGDSEPTLVRLQPVRALTFDERYDDREPARSPDGQRVAFTRLDVARKQPGQLWTVSIRGDDATPADASGLPVRMQPPIMVPGRQVGRISRNSLRESGRAGRDLAHAACWGIRRLTDPAKYDDFLVAF